MGGWVFGGQIEAARGGEVELTDVDFEMLAVVGGHVRVVVLPVTPLAEHFLRFARLLIRDFKDVWVGPFLLLLTYHAVELMEDAEPGQIAPSRELNGFLPMGF